MIKKFKYFDEAWFKTKSKESTKSEELSLEKKFEYIEDLFVVIEDLGYKVKHERGYTRYNERSEKTIWYTTPNLYDNGWTSNRVVINPPSENKLGIGVIYQNDIDRFIKFQKKLIDIYEKLLLDNINVCASYTSNGSMIVVFIIEKYTGDKL